MSDTPRTTEELEQRVARLETQLAAVSRELQSITYAVSHDLRAPLRSISGFCQVLQEDISSTLDAEHRHYLERIQESAAKLSQQIDALLELSRAGSAELQIRDVDVTQRALTILQNLPDRPAGLRIDVQPGMRVQADSLQLETILQQLLHNAIKVTKQSAEPHIGVTQIVQPHTTILCVADNGVGFDPKYNDRLFAPFQRLHADPALAGAGIGLALVQRLVARHNGRVWAEGQPGVGAKFFVELPQHPGV